VGHIAEDPDVRLTTSGDSVARFSLWVDRPAREDSVGTNQRDLLLITAWRQLAETAKTLQKGQLVYAEGRIITRTFDDEQGNKKYITEVDLRELKPFLGSEAAAVQSSGFQATSSEKASATPKAASVMKTKEVPTVKEEDFDFNEANFNEDIQLPPDFAMELDEKDVPF